MFKISAEGHFSAAHFLEDYKGFCGSVHGHRWRCVVTVEASKNPETCMLMDFKELKNALEIALTPMDHAFLINPDGNEVSKDFYTLLKKHKMRIYEFRARTTAENIAQHIYSKLKAFLPPHDKLYVEVFEAPTNGVIYTE